MRFSKSLLSRFAGVRFVSLSRSQRRKLRGSPVAAETLEVREMPAGVATLPQVDLVAIDASKTVNAQAYFHVRQYSVRFGDTVTIDLAIANQGASPSSASATFDVKFVLLPNGSAPLSVGVVVGTASGISIPRSGGTTFLNQFQITLPEVAPFAGSGFSLAAVIDPLNIVQESNEANNSGQGLKRDIVDLTILPMLPNKPDLVAVDASRSIHSRAYFHIQQNSMRFGDTVKVDLAIANQGTSPASGANSNLFDVNFILLPNSSTPLNQGVFVGTATNLKVPNAGQSIFLDGFSLKLPEAAPFAGRGFTLMAVIDPQNKVVEFNESNNSLQGARRDGVDITIDPKLVPGIDLVAIDASTRANSQAYFHVESTPIQFGDTIQVDLAVTNQGSGAVPLGTSFDVSFVLLPNSTTPITHGTLVGLAQGLMVPQPGAVTLLNRYSITLPPSAPFSGINFTLAAVVNSTGRVAEINESNNFNQGPRRDVVSLTIATPIVDWRNFGGSGNVQVVPFPGPFDFFAQRHGMTYEQVVLPAGRYRMEVAASGNGMVEVVTTEAQLVYGAPFVDSRNPIPVAGPLGTTSPASSSGAFSYYEDNLITAATRLSMSLAPFFSRSGTQIIEWTSTQTEVLRVCIRTSLPTNVVTVSYARVYRLN